MLLGRRIHDEIILHARSHLPREAAGLLWGANDRVRSWTPMTNAAEGCKAFRMDADEFKNAMESATDPLLAILHSHPTEPPVPSTSDLAGAVAWRSVFHLILSFADGTARFRAWRLFDGQALPEPLHIILDEDHPEEESTGSSTLEGTARGPQTLHSRHP